MRGAQVASNAALSMQPTERRQGLRRARTSSVHAKFGREGFLAKSCRGGLRLEQHALPFSWRCVQRQKQHSKALAEPRAVPTVRSEGTSAARPEMHEVEKSQGPLCTTCGGMVLGSGAISSSSTWNPACMVWHI